MFIFITSIVLVSFISLCFFKNRFWENRYLILLICGGVALVATLITNYIVRGHLSTKVEFSSTKPLFTFYIQDSLIKDSVKTFPYVKNWDFYNDNNASVFLYNLHKRISTHIVIYTVRKNMYVGVFSKTNKQNYYLFNNVYITSSNNDSTAFITKKILRYDTNNNKWLTEISFPQISTITILYIPPKEYKAIPDSLIRKIPY